MKEKDRHIQEEQKVPKKMNTKRPTLKHIIIKTTKDKNKERIFKAAQEGQLVTYKGAPIDCQLIFSTETSWARGIGTKYSKKSKARTCN